MRAYNTCIVLSLVTKFKIVPRNVFNICKLTYTIYLALFTKASINGNVLICR